MNLGRRSLVLAICVFLAAVVWAVFGQTINYEFINLDDSQYVVKNPVVARGLTSQGFIWAFSQVHAANWHPLTWISHMIDCQLYGLNPRGHHLTNVLLHTATAVLLFLSLLEMTQALWPSAFVAAVFAIHPLRAESVAWVAERKDVLSGLFFMLTIAAYIRYARRRSLRSYLLVTLLFVAGLLCKPMLVTLPAVLLLLDYWPLRRWETGSTRHLLLEKLPLFVCGLAVAIATIFAQHEAIVGIVNVPLMIRLGNAITSCMVYVRQMLWPSHLAAFYPFPPGGISLPAMIFSLLLLIVISVAVFFLRTRKYFVTGWLWYLIMLGPVIGIIQVGEQAHADRYTYLPQIGLCIALAWGIRDFCSRWPRAPLVLAPVAAMILAALIINARAATSRWRNSEALWRHALSVTSDNSFARRNLAEALQRKGKFEEALENYRRALAFDPAQVLVHTNLGAMLLEMGLRSEAVEHFEIALKLQPKYTEAESDLGLALFELGRVDESVSHLQRALEIDPEFADAHYNLGNSFLDLGRLAESISEYKKAIELDPRDERALNNLAWILATAPADEIRDGRKAIEYARRADELTKNQNPVINATLAAAYAESGRFDDATRTASHASELATAQGNAALADSIHEQLRFYQSQMAFRDNRGRKSSR